MIRAECKRPLDDEEDEDEEGEERDEFFPDGPPSPEVSERRPRVINLLEMDYFKSKVVMKLVPYDEAMRRTCKTSQ